MKPRSARPRRLFLEALEARELLSTADTLQFSTATYRVREAENAATITVTRSGPLDSSVSVHYDTLDGTARAGLDYTATSGDAVFNPGQTSQSFTIPVIDNQVIDGNRTVELMLSAPTGDGQLGDPRVATLIVTDDDGVPDERFLAQVFLDLIGRRIDDGSLRYWPTQLGCAVSISAERASLVQTLQTATEPSTVLVNELYLQYLGRLPDIVGRGAGLLVLDNTPPDSGGVDPVELLRAALIGSDEYYQRAGGTTDGFLAAVYRDVLDRTPDPQGAAAWKAALENGLSRGALALAVLGSDEGAAVLGEHLYTRFLRRDIDPSSQTAFVAARQNGLDERAAIGIILGSDEYYTWVFNGDLTPDQRFVNRVAADLLGRAFTPDEQLFWVRNLGCRPSSMLTRNDMVVLLESTAEYASGLVNSLYVQYLGRPADLAAHDAGVSFLDNPNYGFDRDQLLEQLRAALLGSDEYYQRAGGTDDGFVAALYRDVLGRTPDPAGAAAATAALQSGVSRSDLAYSVLVSSEGTAVLGQNLYQRFLHRDIDAGGRDALLTARQHGVGEQNLIADLLASPEYYNSWRWSPPSNTFSPPSPSRGEPSPEWSRSGVVTAC
jgi:hypothetical protein